MTLAAAMVFALAQNALAISRDSALNRAQNWVDNPVKYSQAKYHLGYRTDCSGYVSMCWATRTSWSTSTFHAVTHRIKVSQLKPGDAMLKRGYHIRLFYGWLDEAHTAYVAYESGYGKVAVARPHSLASDLAAGYVPVRYDRISDSAVSTNVLRNRSFDTWPREWSEAPERPAWWSVSGPGYSTFAARRRDVYRTARNSLHLTNPSTSPDDSTEMSQTVSVTPGFNYTLSAWVQTPSGPDRLSMRLAYFNAAGQTLAETSTVGASWGLGDSAFRRVYTTLAAPAGTAKARVLFSLAGGVTTETATGVASPGTSAVIDDATLTRPKVAVGIGASARTIRRGRAVTLRGSVAPTSAVGATLSVYVAPPGKSWRRCAKTTVVSAGSSAGWSFKYKTSKRGRRGTYRFRVVAPGVPGYLGTTSNSVSVRAK